MIISVENRKLTNKQIQKLPLQFPITFPEFQKEMFNNFVVSQANTLAYKTARSFCFEENFSFDKIYFFGARGLGKSHLLKAIGQHYTQHFPKKKIVYLSLRDIIKHYHTTKSYEEVIKISNDFKDVDLLLLDDIHLSETTTLVQDQVFHIFNELVQKQKRLVIAGRKSPEQMPLMQTHLKSRLATCIVTKLNRLDDNSRREILKKIAKDKGVDLSPLVVDYILTHFSRDIIDFKNLFTTINTYSLSTKKKITIRLIKNMIDLLPESCTKKSITTAHPYY